MILGLATKQALVNLNSHSWASKQQWCVDIDKSPAADVPEILIRLYSTLLPYLSLLGSITDWILPYPPIYQEDLRGAPEVLGSGGAAAVDGEVDASDHASFALHMQSLHLCLQCPLTGPRGLRSAFHPRSSRSRSLEPKLSRITQEPEITPRRTPH